MKKSCKTLVAITGLIAALTLGSCGTSAPSSQQSSPHDDTSLVETFTVTWKNGDTVLETDSNVVKGTTPTYDGAEPTKQGTAQYSYKFKGWSPAISAVVSDVTYQAQFEQTVNKYDIKWVNEDNTVIKTDKVEYGTVPTYKGEAPKKQGNAQYSYTFEKWNPTPAAVTGAATYKASFTRSINKYTVTFDVNGGSKVDSITKDYGTQIEKPTNPTKEGYKFVAWTTDKEGTKEATFPFELKENVTLYAKWNENVQIMTYLKALLTGFKISPLSFIPEEVLPTNADNLIANEAAMTFDYKQPVNISSIKHYGYGEQWNMVVDNLYQSMTFFDLLSVVETIADTSITAFNNYFDKNPADSATHTTKVGDYDVTIKLADDILAYALSFTTKGDHTAEIWLNYNVKTGERAGRLQIGDVNALKYVATENRYEFALRFAGVRRSYFKVTRDENGNIAGQINEHTGLDGKLDVVSAAQFFIEDNKLIVVGNKAEAMLASHPVVVEAYDATNGHLLGFEIQESIKSIVYNTLWFNLDDQTGINKFQNAELTDAEGNVTHEIRINGLNSKFETKHVGGLSAKTLSRRYDLELRDRFYTHKEIDAEGKATYVTKGYKVPMLFVQEEMLEDLEKDMNKENKGLNFKLTVPQTTIDLITSNYATRIEPFNLVKEAVSQQAILDFIGTSFVA